MAKKKRNDGAHRGGATGSGKPVRGATGSTQPRKTPRAPITTPRTRREVEAEREARRKRNAGIIKIVAIILIAVALAGIIAMAIYNAILGHEVDYDNDDLSRYVYLSEDDYKNIAISVKLNPVDELSIDDALIKMLYNFRTVDPDYEGKTMTSLRAGDVLGAGDDVNLFYIGYMKNDDGSITYFNGGSNIHGYTGSINDVGDPCKIGYTSSGSEKGEMIPGFALGLIGKNPADYSKLALIKDRAVALGDLISFTYFPFEDEGTSTDTTPLTVTLHIGSKECEELFGEGFNDFIVGRELGDIKETFTKDVDGKKTYYTKMKVNAIYDRGDNPLTVTARFPVDYASEELAGKVVFFDLYVREMKLYDIPEINEEFITERLGMTLEELDEYGDGTATTIYEKLRDYVRSEVIAANKLIIDAAVEEKMWDVYLEKTITRWIPEREIREYYEDYVSDIESKYSAAEQNGNADNIDGYALTYLGLEPGDDWHAHLRETAIRSVTEKLTFYYVLRREGFIPNDEEYERMYNEVVDEILADYLVKVSCKREDFATDEEYEAKVAEHRQTVISIHGDEYFRENVIYLYALEKMLAMADVTEVVAEPISSDLYTPVVL